MIHLWIISALAASVILSGCSAPAVTSFGQALETTVSSTAVATIPAETLSPIDRKAMEDLALLFGQKYYTYTPENYQQVNESLLPLLTTEYIEKFQKLTLDGAVSAQAVQAQSVVEVVQILSVDKLSSNQGKIKFQFKARVSSNGKETENIYSTAINVRKQGDEWKINEVLTEQPVEFLNIQNLL